MHKLKEKRGKKTVTHHFSHVTDNDGSKKHVYLGTSPKKARNKLTKLRVERVRSQDRLVREMDKVQSELKRLGHHERSYDEVMSDLRKRHYREKHIDRMFGDDLKYAFPTNAFVITLAVVLFVGGLVYVAYSDPEVTGAAVSITSSLAARQLMATSAGMLVIILVLGAVMHYADHRHRHRHDRYKHPKMLE